MSELMFVEPLDINCQRYHWDLPLLSVQAKMSELSALAAALNSSLTAGADELRTAHAAQGEAARARGAAGREAELQAAS